MKLNLDAFRQFLIDTAKSERTISGYIADIGLFSRWFEETNGEALCPANLTPTDVREYKQHLLNIQVVKPGRHCFSGLPLRISKPE